MSRLLSAPTPHASRTLIIQGSTCPVTCPATCPVTCPVRGADSGRGLRLMIATNPSVIENSDPLKAHFLATPDHVPGTRTHTFDVFGEVKWFGEERIAQNRTVRSSEHLQRQYGCLLSNSTDTSVDRGPEQTEITRYSGQIQRTPPIAETVPRIFRITDFGSNSIDPNPPTSLKK